MRVFSQARSVPAGSGTRGTPPASGPRSNFPGPPTRRESDSVPGGDVLTTPPAPASRRRAVRVRRPATPAAATPPHWRTQNSTRRGRTESPRDHTRRQPRWRRNAGAERPRQRIREPARQNDVQQDEPLRGHREREQAEHDHRRQIHPAGLRVGGERRARKWCGFHTCTLPAAGSARARRTTGRTPWPCPCPSSGVPASTSHSPCTRPAVRTSTPAMSGPRAKSRVS